MVGKFLAGLELKLVMQSATGTTGPVNLDEIYSFKIQVSMSICGN